MTVDLLVVAMFLAGATAVELVTGVLVLATMPLTLEPELMFERYDLWPAALVMLAVIALLRGRGSQRPCRSHLAGSGHSPCRRRLPPSS